MNTRLFTITDIVIPPDTRPVHRERVRELAASIQEIGLLHPITVRVVPSMTIEGEEVHQVPVLVSGRHRLEALKHLDHEEVEVSVVDMDDLHAALAEIDENLVRENLSPAQEATQIARRKVIYETLHPETRSGTAGGKARQGTAGDKLSFAEATAQATGRDKRTVQRVAARGAKLSETLSRVVGTSLDKGIELDALARLPKQRQEELIQRAATGVPVSARVEVTSPQAPRQIAKTRPVRPRKAIGLFVDGIQLDLFGFSPSEIPSSSIEGATNRTSSRKSSISPQGTDQSTASAALVALEMKLKAAKKVLNRERASRRALVQQLGEVTAERNQAHQEIIALRAKLEQSQAPLTPSSQRVRQIASADQMERQE